ASANAVWGNRRAILVGVFLHARASWMIVEDGDLEICWIFANTIRLITEGELLQLERSFDPTVTEQHYYGVIERKSAELLSAGCACGAGAILAGVPRAERRRMAEFGRQVGLAFQLRDDALDYSAGEGEIGKRPCADLREGKVTLPLALALKRATAAERAAAAALLKTAARRAAELSSEGVSDSEQVLSDEDLEPVQEMVRRYRGLEDTDRRAREHAERALAAVAPFPDGVAKRALLDAAAFSVTRAH